METKRVPSFRDAGWSVRGDLHVNGGEPIESLAKRFALESPGRWKVADNTQAVSALGLSLKAGGLESDFHTHRESELIYQVKGELTCEAANALWIIPPQSVLWLPANAVHKIRGRAPLEGYCLFIDPVATAAAALPTECSVLSVSPLFRELLLCLAMRPAPYAPDGPDARLVGVLLDELARAQIEKHRLPIPSDARLRRLVDEMIARPADGATMHTWAKRIGVGERTLARLFVHETGLSFGRWRRQLHITLAIQALSRGAAVQNVATDLGYESASSFVTMFKKTLGTSPARYMAKRLASRQTTLVE